MSDTTYYAIGDVHGEAERLIELLSFIAEDAVRAGAAYEIIFLGDLIDRGPNSREVVARAMKLTQSGVARTVIGNHEQMLLDAIDSPDRSSYATWNLNGGDSALDSYEAANGTYTDWRDAIDGEHIHWLRNLPTMIRDEERKLAFVHAGIDPKTFPNCSDEHRIWTRSQKFFDPGRWPARPELDGWRVIHGHTPTDDFKPHVNPRRINVDTGACFGGPLTCVVLSPEKPPRFLHA